MMYLFGKYYQSPGEQYSYSPGTKAGSYYAANYPKFMEWETKEEKLTSTEVNASNEKLVPVTRYADLNPGDVVEITRRIEVRDSDKFGGVKSKDNRTYRLEKAADGHYTDLPGFKMMKVENSDPAYWPPKPGDVWEAEGHEYHAQHSNFSEGKIVLRPTDPYNNTNLNVNQLKNKKPVLRYRKGVKL